MLLGFSYCVRDVHLLLVLLLLMENFACVVLFLLCTKSGCGVKNFSCRISFITFLLLLL